MLQLRLQCEAEKQTLGKQFEQRIAGMRLEREQARIDKGVLKRIGISRSVGVCLVFLTIALFVATQIVQENATVDDFGSVDGARYFAIFTSLYKMGISIYGGGQVVLPLLESEFVERTGYDSSNYTSSDFGRTSVAASLCLPLVDADGSFRCRSGDPISLTSSCPCPPVSAET